MAAKSGQVKMSANLRTCPGKSAWEPVASLSISGHLRTADILNMPLIRAKQETDKQLTVLRKGEQTLGKYELMTATGSSSEKNRIYFEYIYM